MTSTFIKSAAIRKSFLPIQGEMEKQLFYRIVEFVSNGLARIQEKFLKSKKKNMSRTKKRFLDVKKAEISNKFGKSQVSTFKVFLFLFVSHIAKPPRAG